MAGCGVDGCRSGWFFFEIDKERYTYGVVSTLREVVQRTPHNERIFVDVPIGLRDTSGTPRMCDEQARRILGPRRSSVFPAPIRAILKTKTYKEANDKARRLTRRVGISKQTFAIIPKIAEVDDLLQYDARARAMIREVHPEVCFWALAGRRPMQFNKKTQKGFEERLQILATVWRPAEDAIAKAYLWCAGLGVARDDVVDALVLAVTAAQPEEQLSTIPDEPERDTRGLPMEMVFASDL